MERLQAGDMKPSQLVAIARNRKKMITANFGTHGEHERKLRERRRKQESIYMRSKREKKVKKPHILF